MSETAIAIFAYNRADSLSRLLESLDRSIGTKASEFPVFIFVDGPRRTMDIASTSAVISIAEGYTHPNKTILARNVNLGLRTALYDGISEVLDHYSSIIVLEDDLILGPNALDYFTRGLMIHSSSEQVSSICGYSLVESTNNQHPDEAYFLPMTHPWGWATWRDRWQAHKMDLELPPDPSLLCSRSFCEQLNVYGLRNFRQMIKLSERGLINSWWIYWHFHAVRRHQVSLFPSNNQVLNAGFNGKGTHSSSWNILRNLRPARIVSSRRETIPRSIHVNFTRLDQSISSPEAKLDRIFGFLGMLKRSLRAWLIN